MESRRFLREPLMHFLVLGALLFVAHRLFRELEPDPQRIELGGALRAELAQRFAEREGRSPSGAELGAELEQWKREEIDYREGLRLGLDRDDPVVRARVVTKLRELEGELAPARYALEHYFVAGGAEARSRAARILGELEAGRTPDDVGDEFALGRVLRGLGRRDLSATFGQRFAEEVALLEPGRWRLLTSESGQHVVRLLEAPPARSSPGAARRGYVFVDEAGP